MVHQDLRRRGTGADQRVAKEGVHRHLESAVFEHRFVAPESVVVHRPADVVAVEDCHQRRGNAATLDDAGHPQAVGPEMRDDNVALPQFTCMKQIDCSRELVPRLA